MNHAIELPQSLLNRLNKFTAGTRATPASIVKQAVKDRLDYENGCLQKWMQGWRTRTPGEFTQPMK